ncbi:hypothetical protein BDV35DRAFT_407674 [Aspergillus flavus]|uniref:Uncharacterized protein n=1 Tax=Aspergillus flavus TaxID=5059 RepID=A0A5N6GM39_ASPFL|nr:hypothetical protein BDV35DRAFT_407674 [Aspergillus flavus]
MHRRRGKRIGWTDRKVPNVISGSINEISPWLPGSSLILDSINYHNLPITQLFLWRVFLEAVSAVHLDRMDGISQGKYALLSVVRQSSLTYIVQSN